MLLEFRLTMPNVGSWNGKWTGESNYYAKVINYTKIYGSSKASKEKLESVIGNHYYNFGDGWGANVLVKQVDSKKASQIRRKTKGFMGYDWMIESILDNGKIIY